MDIIRQVQESGLSGCMFILKICKKLGWDGFRYILLNIGGLILLGLSLHGKTNKLNMSLRIPAFIIGIIALIDTLFIIEGMLGIQEGMSTKWQSIGEADLVQTNGLDGSKGRVYIEPRVPNTSGTGTETVEIRGNPGKKVVYWPSGGIGMGLLNDNHKVEDIRDPTILRDKALGCGVVILDERGRGVGLAERGCSKLLYREVSDSGYGGPIGNIIVDGNKLISDGNRGVKNPKNSMGGLRPAVS